MIVVSDTSPLTALITIQQIDLLQKLYGEVKIPPAVAEELLAYHTAIPSFIQIVPVTAIPLLTELNRRKRYQCRHLCIFLEREAERHLIETAAMAGLDLEQMELLKKNDTRKEMVAWPLTKKTSVTQDWIAKRLSMGNRANVSRAVRHIGRSDKREVKEWKAKTGKMHGCLH